MYTTFQQTFAYTLYTVLKEPWQLNLVYKIYIKKENNSESSLTPS